MTRLATYSATARDRMRVRHDAQARLTITSGRRVLEDRLVEADAIGGAITVASIIYNRLSYSGGVDWCDPSTGASIARPKFKIRFRPTDVLSGEMLCSCRRCA